MTIEIFMPFYSEPDIFREAVRSVLAQTDPRWKLVVVDDCYPHYTPDEWLASLGDDRVSYVRNEHNLGINLTFQRCVDLATEDWLTIMGNDDRLLPSYVGRMHELVALGRGVGYIQPGVEVIDADGAVSRPLPDRVKDAYRPRIHEPTVLGGEELTRSLLRGNWTYFPSICWRRETIATRGFRPDLGVVLDLSLLLDLTADGQTMMLDTVPAFQYRRHAASVSSWTADDGSRFVEEKSVLLRAEGVARDLGWRRAARAGRWHVSSRLSALSRLPAVLRSRRLRNLGPLLRHVFTNRLPR